MKTWVDSQVEMHRQLAETEVLALAKQRNIQINPNREDTIQLIAKEIVPESNTPSNVLTSGVGNTSVAPSTLMKYMQSHDAAISTLVSERTEGNFALTSENRDINENSPRDSNTSWDELLQYEFVSKPTASQSSMVSPITYDEPTRKHSTEKKLIFSQQQQQQQSSRDVRSQLAFDVSVVDTSITRSDRKPSSQHQTIEMNPPSMASEGLPKTIKSRQHSTQHLLRSFPSANQSSVQQSSSSACKSPERMSSSHVPAAATKDCEYSDSDVQATPKTIRTAWQQWRSSEEVGSMPVDINMPRQSNHGYVSSSSVQVDSHNHFNNTGSVGVGGQSVTSYSTINSHNHRHNSTQSSHGGRSINSGDRNKATTTHTHGSLSELSPASFKDQMGRLRQENFMVRDDISRFREKLQVQYLMRRNE